MRPDVRKVVNVAGAQRVSRAASHVAGVDFLLVHLAHVLDVVDDVQGQAQDLYSE